MEAQSGRDTLRMGHVEAFYDTALDRAGALQGRVLDAGCGDGTLLAALKKRFPAVQGVGLDRLPSPSTRIVGDLKAIPFRDGTFDAAFCLGVLSYVGDPEKALRELFRVLKPGGRLFLGLPDRRFREVQALKNRLRLRFGYTGVSDPENLAFAASEAGRMLAAAGFGEVRLERAGPPAAGRWLSALLSASEVRKRLWLEARKP